MRQIILDTETTGLNPESGHRIIEIACLEMINRRITGNHFHQYINPQRDIDRGAEEVHGLTAEFLADKPIFSHVMESFLTFVKDAELIIHNAPFDIAFLNYELALAKNKVQKITDLCSIIDTLPLARRKHPGQQNNLDALCKRYQVDNSNRKFHGALLDTELLAQVYLNMTGGQVHLFNEIETQAQEKITVSQQVRTSNLSTPVVYANTEELKAHQEFLEKVLKIIN